jgi:hypothetical protein
MVSFGEFLTQEWSQSSKRAQDRPAEHSPEGRPDLYAPIGISQTEPKTGPDF